MTQDESLRKHLVDLLRAGHAHVTFDTAVKDWKPELRGVKPAGAVHSAWQLLEHLRISQWDIVDFSKSADHVSPNFPDGYWPDEDAPADDAAWESSLEQFRRDHEAMQALVQDATADLHAPIPHGDGQTILREALMVAQHNGYHIGQLMTLRKMLGAY